MTNAAAYDLAISIGYTMKERTAAREVPTQRRPRQQP
jgi:hypothetical protein